MKISIKQGMLIALLVTSQAVFAMSRYPGAKKGDLPATDFSQSLEVSEKQASLRSKLRSMVGRVNELKAECNADLYERGEKAHGEQMEILSRYLRQLADGTTQLASEIKALFPGSAAYEFQTNKGRDVIEALLDARELYYNWAENNKHLAESRTITTANALRHALNKFDVAMEKLDFKN
jgi:hypothetical protein